jgi:uncharacterized protein (TIGR03435 family)
MNGTIYVDLRIQSCSHRSTKGKPFMPDHAGRTLCLRKKLLLLVAAWSVSLLSSRLAAQAPPVPDWQTAAGAKMSFDVASVRLSPPNTRPRGDQIQNPFNETPPKGGLFSANGQVLAYIAFAYKLRDIPQIMALQSKLPAWSQTNSFDIEARAEGTPTLDQMRLMMQSLLVERFKLAVHYETKQQPVFALVLDKPGKTGPQLQPHPADTPCPEKPEKPAPIAPNTAPPPHCGMDGWQANGLLHVRMIDVTMEQAASLLGGMGSVLGDLGQRSTVDQTGLTGHFDINLDFLPEKPGGPSANSDTDATGPTITAALKNQLGMKLIKQTGTVNIFTLDHIEMPSEN